MLTNTASSGLQAAMANLQVISNNMTNTNTIGFKQSDTRFADIYSASASTNNSIGMGVAVAGIDQDFSEGSTEQTGRSLDLSLRGEGFFTVQNPNSGLITYSRAGQFFNDKDGYIATANGDRVQGYEAVLGVITPNLIDMQVPSAPLTAQATGTINFDINLDASSTVIGLPFDFNNSSTYNYRSDSVVYDSLGTTSTLTTYYVKTSNNNWDAHVYVGATNLGSGTAVFNTSGTLQSTAGLAGLNWNPGGGALSPQPITIDVTGSTQLASPMQTRNTIQNGYAAGTITSFDVDENGILKARYSNGEALTVGQLAVAKFKTPQGLAPVGDMSWIETGLSGIPVTGPANSNGAIRPGTLELSNVDLTEQLVKVLTAQHDFQANAKMISTADELNRTIINI